MRGGCSFSLGSLSVFSRFCALAFGLHFVRRLLFGWGSSDSAGVVGEVRILCAGCSFSPGSLWASQVSARLGSGFLFLFLSSVWGAGIVSGELFSRLCSSARAWRVRCAFGVGVLGFCAQAVGWVRASFVSFQWSF